MQKEVPAGTFPGQGLLPLFAQVLAQGFAVDVLHDPYRPLRRDDPTLAPYFELADRHAGFRLLDGVPIDQLAGQLGGYNFALNLFDIPAACAELRREQITSAVGTKLFAYLEGGLPVIVNREYQRTAALVEDAELGLALHSTQIPRLSEIIAGTDQGRLRRRVRRYNEVHGMDKEIHRLIALYQALAPGSDTEAQR